MTDQRNARILVAKAMQSVKEDMKTNADVLAFSLNMVETIVTFLRMVIGEDKVAEFLRGELEELKTPLTPEDYPPGHPKGQQ